MALNISGYVDPGAYVGFVAVPGSVSVTSQRTLGIVAIGPRTRRAEGELVVRGKIYDETLAAWTGSSPYRCVLANVSNRDRNSAILYKNDVSMGLAEWSFAPAKMTGNAVAGAAMDTTLKHKFTLSMDGKDVTTLTLTTKAPATTLVTIASELNTKLVAVSAYGSAYAGVFTTIQTGAAPNDTLVITSPITTSASDIKVFLSYEDAAGTYDDMASTVSNAAWAPTYATGVQADTYVEVIDASYSSTATWSIDYVAVDQQTDPLEFATTDTPLDDIITVGYFPGASSYTEDTDYEENANLIDWHIAGTTAQATVTSTLAAPYAPVLNTSDHLYISVNNLAVLNVTLLGTDTTAALVAERINLAFNASSVYGPEYAYVASVSGGTKVAFTAPLQFENFPTSKGYNSSITFSSGTYNAFSLLFGATTLPYDVRGAGQRPTFGSSYYITYDYDRDADDYNVPQLVYSTDQMYAYTTRLTPTNYTVNKLATAGEIAFLNGSSSLYLVQIDDSVSPGSPTSSEIHEAIDGAETKTGITDIVVIDTTEDSAVYLMQHVSSMSSPLNKKYRRGWYGMARDTDVGDPDTPDTFVYRATRTLQPGNDSTGRGRQILVAPANSDRVLTLSDGTEVTLECHSAYLATAVAALFTSLPSPSDCLVRKMITGFVTDSTFETYLDAERRTLADNGVTVVTLDAGRLLLLDPLTTEAGGAGVVQFEEPQSSAARDAVTNTVTTLLDLNVVGIVPDDLADFITDVKTWIMLAILANIENGTIAPYRDSSGNIRDIDPKTDIKVEQSIVDPRTYNFKYWFNLKYPAKRFFGEYSVDNPFFSS